MKHFKLYLALAALILTMGTAAAFGEEAGGGQEPNIGWTYDEASEVMTIHGTLTDGTAIYDDVAVALIREGRTLADLTDFTQEKIMDVFVDYQQDYVKADGTFTVCINMHGCEAGDYEIRVATPYTQQTPYVKEIYYATKQNKVAFVTELIALYDETQDTKVQVQKLQEKLELNKEDGYVEKMFNLSEQLIFQVDDYQLANILYSMLKTLDAQEPVNFVNAVNLAALLQGLNEGKISDIAPYQELFALDTRVVKTYQDMVAKEQKESFAKEFMGKGFTVPADVQTAYTEYVLLTVLNYFQNTSQITYIIENYSNEIGLNLTAYNQLSTTKKTEVAVELGKKGNFADYLSFKKAFDDEVGKQQGNSSTGSRPAGGGDNNGSSGYPVPPVTIDNNIEKREPQNPVTSETKFDDLSGVPWAAESIEKLARMGVLSGTGDRTFTPGRSITREEFAVMIARACGLDAQSGSNGFRDAQSDAWYYDMLTAAKNAGLILGKDDGTFGIGSEITRQEMCAIAYRAGTMMEIDFGGEQNIDFADQEKISEYARPAVMALKNKQIVSGMGDNQFQPDGICTRAQAAKIICGLLELKGDVQ
mgnify:CR=1 FL=1